MRLAVLRQFAIMRLVGVWRIIYKSVSMTDDDQWWSWPWSRWLWCTKRGWRRGWLRFSSFFNIWSHGINAVGQASSPTTAPSTPPKFEGRWTFSETVWNRTSILVWCIFRPEDIFACLIVFLKIVLILHVDRTTGHALSSGNEVGCKKRKGLWWKTGKEEASRWVKRVGSKERREGSKERRERP